MKYDNYFFEGVTEKDKNYIMSSCIKHDCPVITRDA